MKRYRMSLLVRSDEQDGDAIKRAEWQVECYVMALSHSAARRYALERAYAEHLLVSRFLEIKVRVI